MREGEKVYCQNCPVWQALCYDSIDNVPATSDAKECPIVTMYDNQPTEEDS